MKILMANCANWERASNVWKDNEIRYRSNHNDRPRAWRLATLGVLGQIQRQRSASAAEPGAANHDGPFQAARHDSQAGTDFAGRPAARRSGPARFPAHLWQGHF